MKYIAALLLLASTALAAAAPKDASANGGRVPHPALDVSGQKVCTIKTPSKTAPCRWCPFTSCPVKKYIEGSADFTCWYYSGSPENGISFWDKTADGCWVNEFYIEDNCWNGIGVCQET